MNAYRAVPSQPNDSPPVLARPSYLDDLRRLWWALALCGVWVLVMLAPAPITVVLVLYLALVVVPGIVGAVLVWRRREAGIVVRDGNLPRGPDLARSGDASRS